MKFTCDNCGGESDDVEGKACSMKVGYGLMSYYCCRFCLQEAAKKVLSPDPEEREPAEEPEDPTEPRSVVLRVHYGDWVFVAVRATTGQRIVLDVCEDGALRIGRLKKEMPGDGD